jgi:hypothetical protein
MCNSILISPLTVSAVGPVVPVVLHRIWCEQVVPPGGTGGTGVRRGHAAPCGTASIMVPPVPPIGPTKSLQNCLQYHRSHRSHPVARPSCLGDEKRL